MGKPQDGHLQVSGPSFPPTGFAAQITPKIKYGSILHQNTSSRKAAVGLFFPLHAQDCPEHAVRAHDVLEEQTGSESSAVSAHCAEHQGSIYLQEDEERAQEVDRSPRDGPICSPIHWKNKRNYNVPMNRSSYWMSNHIVLVCTSDF